MCKTRQIVVFNPPMDCDTVAVDILQILNRLAVCAVKKITHIDSASFNPVSLQRSVIGERGCEHNSTADNHSSNV